MGWPAPARATARTVRHRRPAPPTVVLHRSMSEPRWRRHRRLWAWRPRRPHPVRPSRSHDHQSAGRSDVIVGQAVVDRVPFRVGVLVESNTAPSVASNSDSVLQSCVSSVSTARSVVAATTRDRCRRHRTRQTAQHRHRGGFRSIRGDVGHQDSSLAASWHARSSGATGSHTIAAGFPGRATITAMNRSRRPGDQRSRSAGRLRRVSAAQCRARSDLLPGDPAPPSGEAPFVHALYGFARYADEIVDAPAADRVADPGDSGWTPAP